MAPCGSWVYGIQAPWVQATLVVSTRSTARGVGGFTWYYRARAALKVVVVILLLLLLLLLRLLLLLLLLLLVIVFRINRILRKMNKFTLHT